MEAEEEEEDKKKKGTLAAGVSRPKTNPGCLLCSRNGVFKRGERTEVMSPMQPI